MRADIVQAEQNQAEQNAKELALKEEKIKAKMQQVKEYLKIFKAIKNPEEYLEKKVFEGIEKYYRDKL